MAGIQKNIRLTSAEVAHLWTAYVGDTMSECVLKYYLKTVEDPEIKVIIQTALELSQKHVQTIKDIFTKEHYPIPEGFKEQDVNLDAPRLFSDSFFLLYIKHMAKTALYTYGNVLGACTREDVRSYFTECIQSTSALFNMTTKLSLEKGLEVRPPEIPTPDAVDYVHNKNFLGGWLAGKRPLTGMEITNIYNNLQTNSLGKALVIGFSQVFTLDEGRNYMLKGKEIAKKHIDIFNTLLINDDLPAPMTWDSLVTESKISPFSDKLMMYHVSFLSTVGLTNYGISLATSPRADLGMNFMRLSAEAAKYAEEGAKIMIDHGWLERPPSCADRKKLAKG